MTDKITAVRQPSTCHSSAYLVQIDELATCYVFESPFGNCQSFGIKQFNSLVANIEDLRELKRILIDIKSACFIAKPLLVIDICRAVYMKIRKHITFNFKIIFILPQTKVKWFYVLLIRDTENNLS